MLITGQRKIVHSILPPEFGGASTRLWGEPEERLARHMTKIINDLVESVVAKRGQPAGALSATEKEPPVAFGERLSMAEGMHMVDSMNRKEALLRKVMKQEDDEEEYIAFTAQERARQEAIIMGEWDTMAQLKNSAYG